MYQHFVKRILDIVIGLLALIPVGLIVLVCGIAIKLEDGGPVFYNAPRVGKDGKDFIMYKLRSMKVNAPDLVMDDGSTYNGADDPRMTRVGAFMRKTSIDEFPQFLNVLIGNMSLIGPRPDLRRETELYTGEEGLKLTVKPGITGYAAVMGRNSLPWHDRLALDVYYVKHISFALDAKVFFRTFATVFKQEGIYVEDAEAVSTETADSVKIQKLAENASAEALDRVHGQKPAAEAVSMETADSVKSSKSSVEDADSDRIQKPVAEAVSAEAADSSRHTESVNQPKQ